MVSKLALFGKKVELHKKRQVETRPLTRFKQVDLPILWPGADSGRWLVLLYKAQLLRTSWGSGDQKYGQAAPASIDSSKCIASLRSQSYQLPPQVADSSAHLDMVVGQGREKFGLYSHQLL